MDNKVMATSEGNAPGRTVEPARNTETPVTPGSYHEYMGSESKQYGDTYSSRQDAIVKAIGNKDSVRG